jgi:hypothetical protein
LLGGQIVDEKDGNGAKATGFIYAGGQPIARYQSAQLLWIHRDPLNTRERLSNSTGALSGGAEYDPSHSSVGLEDPGPSGDGTDPGLMYPRNGDPTDLSGGCMIDGGVVPCSSAMSQVNGGAGVATDPYETPSTRWNPSLNSGQGGFEIFHAFADRYVGYGPIGARYVGNGEFRGRPTLGGHGGAPSHYERDWRGPDPGDEPQDDCHRFANIVAGIANDTIGTRPDSPGLDVQTFMDKLATTLTEFPSATIAGVTGISRAEGRNGNSSYMRFGSSGFASPYYEQDVILANGTHIPSNQVRHAVGG